MKIETDPRKISSRILNPNMPPFPVPEMVFVPPSEEVQRHARVVNSLKPNIAKMLEGQRYLQLRDRLWQPNDFLPDLGASTGTDELIILQESAKNIELPTLIVVTGNTITEDAVSTYQTWNNRPVGTQDQSGMDQDPMAIWSRKWTAEEYRHHLLLNRYLLLSGRVNMRALDISSESLIANGFDTKTGDDPYKFFIYTAIQERATWIAHKNTGANALAQGAPDLAEICDAVSQDEKRHERFYSDLMSMIFEADPVDSMLALSELGSTGILMPAAYMTDGEHAGPETKTTQLYDQYAIVAQLSGVYTVKDFHNVMSHFLFDKWKIHELEFPAGSTQDEIVRADSAKKARDKMVAKYRRRNPDDINARLMRILESNGNTLTNPDLLDFSWIRDIAA